MEKNEFVFAISKKEIARRKKAFDSLLISLTAGIVIFVLIFLPEAAHDNLVVILAIFFIFILFFLVFRALIFQFFKKHIKTKFVFTGNLLLRKTQIKQDKYSLFKTSSVGIKRTSTGKIREVSISLPDGNLVVDGLEDFEQFLSKLLGRVRNANIAETKEPVDYDNILFYPILGILLSFFTVISIKWGIKLGIESIYIVQKFVAVFILLLGIYFLSSKPLTQRYGRRSVSADIVGGSVMVAVSVFLFMIGII